MTEVQNVDCLLCGSDEHLVLFRRGRHGRRFNTVACRNCGFSFISPRAPLPSNADIQAFYAGGGYRGSDRQTVTTESVAAATALDARARRQFEVIRDQNPEVFALRGDVLDVGANLGHFLGYMKRSGWRPVGCEPDREHAEGGGRHFGVQILPVLYQFTQLGPGRFDLITLSHVLEHCENAREVLRKMHEDLREEGFAYIEVPCIERPCGGDLERFFWTEHVNYFSKNTLSTLLRQEGFQTINSGNIGNFLWIMAKKTRPDTEYRPFPCDEPMALKADLLEAHVAFLNRKIADLKKKRTPSTRTKNKATSPLTRMKKRLRIASLRRAFRRWMPRV